MRDMESMEIFRKFYIKSSESFNNFGNYTGDFYDSTYIDSQIQVSTYLWAAV